jgi:hypothetical protein
MKKNYLLLFLITLLFGMGTMKGKAEKHPFQDVTKEYYFKIGNGYLAMSSNHKFSCVADKSQANLVQPDASSTEDKLSILVVSKTDPDDYESIEYSENGTIGTWKPYKFFEYVTIDGKHYLKTTQGKPLFLTNKNGQLTLETTHSADAVFEYEGKFGTVPAEILEKAEKTLNAFALFQAHRYLDQHKDNEFIGNGLGQYPRPTSISSVDWDYATYRLYLEGHERFSAQNVYSELERLEKGKNAVKINLPSAGTYVTISTKSIYENAVRENAKRKGTRVDIDAAAGGAPLEAKYLKATENGYTLTTQKSEAAVFFFDGQHLTGLDNGFALGKYDYKLAKNEQQSLIAQGKLEKVLDAGSYSIKVGDKFVKLDRNTGISLTANESESHLFLEEANTFELKTDELGLVSFYAPTAVEVPADVEVYAGKFNDENNLVKFKQVSTKQIPAETAVLLRKGTPNSTFTVKKIANAAPISDNALKGYAVSSNENLANAYGLTVEGGSLVFKPLEDGVRAFKAVIYKNGAGTQEFFPTAFVLPTAVEGITVDEAKEEVFDLAGRRVESLVKGQVYVKNGKKFVQK